jgi:hypothetical protein
MSEEHATLIPRLSEYVRVGEAAQALLIEMHSVVSQISEERNGPERDAHVGQELHGVAISIA